MTIRAVIFDVGGVLSRRDDSAPVGAWSARLGMNAGQLATAIFENEVARRATVGRATVEEVWQFVGQQLGLPDADLHAFIADFWGLSVWDTALLDFIRTLKPAVKTGVLSDAWPDARIANTPVMDDLFDVIVYSAEEGIQKPDPEIYRRTLARLDVAPTDAIYIDDRTGNVEAARRLGMHGLLFTDSEAVIAAITALLASPE